MRFDSPQRRIEKIKYKGKFQSRWKAEFEVFSNKKKFLVSFISNMEIKEPEWEVGRWPRQDTTII